ncbi:MAG: helix-turn-helix domain-containing protein, partial [Phycisphaeraceae bacterium]
VVRDSTDVFLCEDEMVSEAMRYIASHVREELTVQALADAMGVSRSTLLRRFEEAIDRSPTHEINRLRVDYIKRLLSETEMPIAEICNVCGFSTASHFTRFFKREAGVTPSAYRVSRQKKA